MGKALCRRPPSFRNSLGISFRKMYITCGAACMAPLLFLGVLGLGFDCSVLVIGTPGIIFGTPGGVFYSPGVVSGCLGVVFG